jgi:predicted nucleotidyltransferase
MTRDEIIATLQRLSPAIRAEGVSGISLFGSRARGDNAADSDVDLLIDIAPNTQFSLYNISGIGLAVEDATGLAAQITLRRALDREMRDRIEPDLIPIF